MSLEKLLDAGAETVGSQVYLNRVLVGKYDEGGFSLTDDGVRAIQIIEAEVAASSSDATTGDDAAGTAQKAPKKAKKQEAPAPAPAPAADTPADPAGDPLADLDI